MIHYLMTWYGYRRAPRADLVPLIQNTDRMIAQFHANRSK